MHESISTALQEYIATAWSPMPFLDISDKIKTAFANLEKLRKITAEGATIERLLWGNHFGKND